MIGDVIARRTRSALFVEVLDWSCSSRSKVKLSAGREEEDLVESVIQRGGGLVDRRNDRCPAVALGQILEKLDKSGGRD
jgi:hypothetical protein